MELTYQKLVISKKKYLENINIFFFKKLTESIRIYLSRVEKQIVMEDITKSK